ncbi:MAG: hypothetical protein GY953_27100, partial [bacterium]|nr:hypothetical protein [bacterium]
MWLYYLERFSEAIQTEERALELLPESHSRNRFAAHVDIGLCCLELGEYAHARRAVQNARTLPLTQWDDGKFAWFQGSLCRKMGRPAEAEHHLSE